jgi:biopolymer transport protein ExbD
LPSSNSSTKLTKKENISIELNKKYVSYQGNKLNLLDLQKKLELVKNKEQSIMINIDKDVPYNKVVQLLDILQLNNLNNIAFVTKKN